MKDSILITGACGQLGSVLVKALIDIHGQDAIFATDIRLNNALEFHVDILNVLDLEQMQAYIEKNSISQIYHLAAILSANGEAQPLNTWDVNMTALLNVLELGRINKLSKIFYPSSIAVYGITNGQRTVNQSDVLTPFTAYGISKAAGENWCQYYFHKYGLDVRSVRYPGLIGHESLPGGGTTDYAVDIFHKAINHQNFDCFLEPNTCLPMMYIPDAIEATLRLMDAPSQQLSIRTSYNIAGMHFSPDEVFHAIKKYYPDFCIEFKPDFRQQIASGWPSTINDINAQLDWNWHPSFGLESMVEDMINNLKKKTALNTI